MKKTSSHIACLACLIVLGVHSPAIAQDTANATPKEGESTDEKPQKDIYSGIIPGVRNLVNHVSKSLAKGQNDTTPNQLTWVGFQPEKTRTRVFFQVASVPNYQMTRSDDKQTITITLPNTKITTRNVTRPVVTGPYKRAVSYIHAKRGRKNTVTITMKVRTDANPQVSQSGNFLYVDFAHTPKEDDK